MTNLEDKIYKLKAELSTMLGVAEHWYMVSNPDWDGKADPHSAFGRARELVGRHPDDTGPVT